MLQDPASLLICGGFSDGRVLISAFRLSVDTLQPHSRGDGLSARKVECPAFEYVSVCLREAVRFQAFVGDLETIRNCHVGPTKITSGVNVDLHRRAFVGLAGIDGVQVARQLAEAFPAGGSPDHENPVNPRGCLFGRFPIRIEPEAAADAVMDDHAFGLDV